MIILMIIYVYDDFLKLRAKKKKKYENHPQTRNGHIKPSPNRQTLERAQDICIQSTQYFLVLFYAINHKISLNYIRIIFIYLFMF